MKKLSIIIVNYNVSFFLEQVLLSIEKAKKDLELEIIVVDNNSADNSVAMVKHKFPTCILIENHVNTGFSKANNQGIAVSQGEYILLLNPDTVVEEDTLIKCCHFMDSHPKAGAIGVMMLDGAGVFLPESKRGLPTPRTAFYKVFGFAALFPQSKKFGRYHLGYLDKNETHEIEVLSGAFMFMRKSTLEIVGNLDEDYFMYGEDIDLSYRITKGGFKNYYFPETRIIHYKGESTKRSSINYVFIFYKAMIIFAQKHFSNRNAKAFSIIIHIAIYIRAFLAILNRTLKMLLLPMIDFVVMYLGMYVIKEYFEANFKTPNHFPETFVQIFIPIYILVWIVTNYFSGGYDRDVKTSKIVRGVLFGTLLISAASNFFDVYRFSKALIIFNSFWAIVAMLLTRLAIHFYKYRNLALGNASKKKVAIIGSLAEGLRAENLLKANTINKDIIGIVAPFETDKKDDNYLGDITRLNEIIKIYNIDELVFCSKDYAAKDIINTMMLSNLGNVNFKILPHDSDYIIGSNSKNSIGEMYTLNIDLNIIQPSAKRNKRLFDFGLSFILLFFSPVLMWFTTKPFQFVNNIWDVLMGKFTLVGFSKNTTVQIPKIKCGIINPISHLNHEGLDSNTTNRLNMMYAKNYNVYTDLTLVIQSFRQLGNEG